jgi:hypothetical protein
MPSLACVRADVCNNILCLPTALYHGNAYGGFFLARHKHVRTRYKCLCMRAGTINLASRALPCLPSALFEIHLGTKPEPLKSVPVEPPITTTSSDETTATKRRAGASNGPSWYEAQDLTVLKAWSNEILEIQPEISMFGSLKTIDASLSIFFPHNDADVLWDFSYIIIRLHTFQIPLPT